MVEERARTIGLLFRFLGSLVGGFFAVLLLYAVISFVLNKLNKNTSRIIRVLASTVIAMLLSKGELVYLVDGILIFFFLKRTKQ